MCTLTLSKVFILRDFMLQKCFVSAIQTIQLQSFMMSNCWGKETSKNCELHALDQSRPHFMNQTWVCFVPTSHIVYHYGSTLSISKHRLMDLKEKCRDYWTTRRHVDTTGPPGDMQRLLDHQETCRDCWTTRRHVDTTGPPETCYVETTGLWSQIMKEGPSICFNNF